MKQSVTRREMPPWHIDRSIGEYSRRPLALGSGDRDDRAPGSTAARPKGGPTTRLPANVFAAAQSGPTANRI